MNKLNASSWVACILLCWYQLRVKKSLVNDTEPLYLMYMLPVVSWLYIFNVQ